MSPERMTATEASFLALEQAHFPMHVAGIVLFDGGKPLTMRELAQLVTRRLARVGRFHQRARTSLVGWPVWERGPRIQLRAHLFHHRLPSPGRTTQLRELCAQIHEERLDRDRPLWEMHLIDGVAGGQQALLVKSHHAITDGIAGIATAERLFDPAPGAARPKLPTMRFAGNHARSRWAALQGLAGLAFTAAGGPLASDGPFNGPISGRRSFGMATLPMPVVRHLKLQLGASVDDVLVATVAAGIRTYLKELRYPEIATALRTMLPVSTRAPGRGIQVRNQVSAIFIDLPMHFDNLPALVHQIRSSKSRLRTVHAAAGSAMAVEAAGLLPAPLHGALLRFVSRLQFANLVLSDVPGPDQDLYLLGRRIIASYPMMPLAPDVGLSIATVSMGGVIGVGVTADPLLVPDAQRLATAIERAFAKFARLQPELSSKRAA